MIKRSVSRGSRRAGPAPKQLDRISVSEEKRPERARQKNGLLFSLLGLLILVEVLTVFAVLASQRFATERALREYTHELLKSVVDETRENAAGYLRQAQDSVSLAGAVFEAGLLSVDEPTNLERYFLEQLRVVPQIDAIYFGDVEGNFIFSKRDADTGTGFFSKIIDTALAPQGRVTLINRDAQLEEGSRRTDPSDRYDPRERPWFALARQSGRQEVWTDPYIFYTSQKPGLTVARAVREPDGRLRGVVGADIELSALSDFLKRQRIGGSGAAFIVYSNGDVLAHPDASGLALQIEGEGLRLKKLSELDPVAARAGVLLKERFPDLGALNETHYDKFQVNDHGYLSMFVPLLAQGRNQWVMGVYAPEDELAKKIREGQRESIFLGVVVSLLVVTAAVLIGMIALRPIHRLQRDASEDPLTGLLNRRGFDEIAAKRLASATRHNRPLTAIMIDIDNFKPVNDRCGHAVGDEVLLVIARRIHHGLSEEDLLGRYGGEEFAVILPDASLEQGTGVAERLRELVDAEPVKTSAGPLHISISLGVAQAGTGACETADLLDRADRGLLQAKREGRNRVVTVAGAAAIRDIKPAPPAVR